MLLNCNVAELFNCCFSIWQIYRGCIHQSPGGSIVPGDKSLIVLFYCQHTAFSQPIAQMAGTALVETREYPKYSIRPLLRAPEVYYSCHTFLHVEQVKKHTAMRESHEKRV